MDFKELMAYPTAQQLASDLAPAIPVLIRMAVDHAIEVLDGLTADDINRQAEAKMELRKAASDQEWQAILDSDFTKAVAKAKTVWEDQQELVKIGKQALVSIIIAAGGAALL